MPSPPHTQRYASADQLSSDIHRYLNGFPIESRAGSWSYRALKYVNRHRYLVTAVAVIFCAAVALVVLMLRKHQEAELRLAAIVTNTHENLYTILDGIQDLPGTIALRRKMIDKGFEDLGAVLKESPNNERALSDFAQLLRRSAYLHYGRGCQSLGDSTTAIAQATEAMRRSERLAQMNRTCIRLLDVAHVHAQLEDLLAYARRDFEGARRLAGEEQGLLREVARLGGNPQDLDWQYAHLAMRRARYALEERDWQSASTYSVEAAGRFHAMKLKADEGQYHVDPDFELYEAVTSALKAIADRSLGRNEDAIKDLDAARAPIEKFHALFPQDSDAVARLLFLRETETETFASGRQCSAAFVNMPETLRIARGAASRDPESVLGREILAAALRAFGSAEEQCGNPSAARPYLKEAVEVYRALALHDPMNTGWRLNLQTVEATLQ